MWQENGIKLSMVEKTRYVGLFYNHSLLLISEAMAASSACGHAGGGMAQQLIAITRYGGQ